MQSPSSNSGPAFCGRTSKADLVEGREKTNIGDAARNRFVALCAVLIAVGMVGAAYAAVPLYFMFCRATGFAGTTQIAAAAPALKGQRLINVRFDANVAPGLPWTFEAETASVQVRTGATATVYFKVRNRASHETAATPSRMIGGQAGSRCSF